MSTAYATSVQADAYFAERLNTDVWDQSTNGDKTKALLMATKAIDRLNYTGKVTVPGQEHQFPRTGIVFADPLYDVNTFIVAPVPPPPSDSVVPNDILIACYECAIAFLDGFDPNLEAEAFQIQSQRLADASVTYDRNSVLENIKAGIPSALAWSYLRPYLREPGRLDFTRVN